MDLERKYVWPRYVALAVLLAMVLGVIWMGAAVQKLRSNRDPIRATRAADTASPVIQTNPGAGRPSDFGSPPVGNAEAGRKLFFEKPEANCAKCHRVSGQGGDLGPALDGIGSRRSRQELRDALLKPNARVLDGYESVIVLLNNNTGISGLLKKETDSELHIMTPEDGMTVIKKADVQFRQRGLSPMPEGLSKLLTEQELNDLVEFMALLRDSNP